MKTSLAIAISLFAAAPLLADDAPTTQPASTSETPATQPAVETQPAKPKAKLNDAPPRKNVPVIIKEAKDVWKLLPEDLRPGKDGKVSDELAEKIKAWAKEGKFELQVQFVATKEKHDDRGRDAFFEKTDGGLELNIKALLRDPKEISKIKDAKYDATKLKPVTDYSANIDEINFSKTGENIKFSLLLKDIKVTKITFNSKYPQKN